MPKGGWLQAGEGGRNGFPNSHGVVSSTDYPSVGAIF